MKNSFKEKTSQLLESLRQNLLFDENAIKEVASSLFSLVEQGCDPNLCVEPILEGASKKVRLHIEAELGKLWLKKAKRKEGYLGPKKIGQPNQKEKVN